MAQPPLPDSTIQPEGPARPVVSVGSGEDMADLRIFWGPEICRLEYLVHLVDTGRVKDDGRPHSS